MVKPPCALVVAPILTPTAGCRAHFRWGGSCVLPDSRGYSPLHVAAAEGHLGLCKFFVIEGGVDGIDDKTVQVSTN